MSRKARSYPEKYFPFKLPKKQFWQNEVNGSSHPNIIILALKKMILIFYMAGKRQNPPHSGNCKISKLLKKPEKRQIFQTNLLGTYLGYT